MNGGIGGGSRVRGSGRSHARRRRRRRRRGKGEEETSWSQTKVGLLRERGVISVRGKWGGSSPSRLLALTPFIIHRSLIHSPLSHATISRSWQFACGRTDSSLHTQRTQRQRTRPHQNTLDMTQSIQSILPSSFMAHSTYQRRQLQQCVLSSSACFASLAFPASLSQDVSLPAHTHDNPARLSAFQPRRKIAMNKLLTEFLTA